MGICLKKIWVRSWNCRKIALGSESVSSVVPKFDWEKKIQIKKSRWFQTAKIELISQYIEASMTAIIKLWTTEYIFTLALNATSGNWQHVNWLILRKWFKPRWQLKGVTDFRSEFILFFVVFLSFPSVLRFKSVSIQIKRIKTVESRYLIQKSDYF